MLPSVETVECKQGAYLLFRTQDYISAHLRAKGEWEPFLVRLSELLVRGQEQPFVLDLGANLGAYSIPLGKALQGAGGSIFAFEPQRIIFYQLCGNIFLNSLDNVHAFNAAIGDYTGEVDLPEVNYATNPNIGAFALAPEDRLPSVVSSLSSKTYAVAMQKLDALETPRRVSLIKLDVEGYERKVLEGGRSFLARHGFPPIIFEMWDAPAFAEERERLMRAFSDLGYEVLALDATNYVAQHPQAPGCIIAERHQGQRIIRRTR